MVVVICSQSKFIPIDVSYMLKRRLKIHTFLLLKSFLYPILLHD